MASADAIAIRDFRRMLRRRRLTNVHWVDNLYRVYVTALVGVVAVLFIGDRLGDAPVQGDALERVRDLGPAWTGVVAAAIIAVGLRSGSRGGPLALERPDIRHILLAPVDRDAALRGPAFHQVRFALFVAAVVGAAAGELAEHRLPGDQLAWIASGALFGLTCAALGYGAALVASGIRLPQWIATGAAVVLLGWAVVDAADALPDGVPVSPTRVVGAIGLWPLEFDPVSLVAVVVAAALLVLGMLRLGAMSLEAAERRSTLVGQLRFAATLQDVRTVIVLRRQLAQEMPRVKPWVRLRTGTRDRMPVWTRGWRGVLRWPLPRLARMALAAAVAGLAVRGVWAGTTPLIVVAGLALYIAGLEATEPLAQELDHPSRRDAVPMESAVLHVHHVPIVLAVLVPVVLLAAAVAVSVTPSSDAVVTAGWLVVPAVFGAAAGGLVSTLKGAPTPVDEGVALPPEAAGPALVIRTAFPPALAVAGLLPVLLARSAVERGDPVGDLMVLPIALAATVFSLVCLWIRLRDEIRESVQAQMQGPAGRG